MDCVIRSLHWCVWLMLVTFVLHSWQYVCEATFTYILRILYVAATTFLWYAVVERTNPKCTKYNGGNKKAHTHSENVKGIPA